MKEAILLLMILIGSSSVFSQSANYAKGMKKGMEMMSTAGKAEDFVAAANHFSRIAEVENDPWLPLYWSAYNYMIAGLQADKDKKDGYYETALGLIEKVDMIKPEESEVLTLKAYIQLMYISVNPMARAPKLSPDAMETLAKAKELNPSNPRPYYVHGQNVFYTPKFYGGGKENAMPLLEEAMQKYNKEDPDKLSGKFLPSWGKGRCEKLLEECKKS